MNTSDFPPKDWAHVVSPDFLEKSSRLSKCVYQLWLVVNRRIASERRIAFDPTSSSTLIFENEVQARLHDLVAQIKEIEYIPPHSILIQDIYGRKYHLAISPRDGGFSVFVERVKVILREGVIDEPGDMIFATHHTIESVPGSFCSFKYNGDSLEHAFEHGLAMLNDLIDKSARTSSKGSHYFGSGRHLAYVDAGTLSYTAGIVGAALFMATSIGPGWIGFLISYLPFSIVTTLAAATHE
jgi:hypothetical protein